MTLNNLKLKTQAQNFMLSACYMLVWMGLGWGKLSDWMREQGEWLLNHESVPSGNLKKIRFSACCSRISLQSMPAYRVLTQIIVCVYSDHSISTEF